MALFRGGRSHPTHLMKPNVMPISGRAGAAPVLEHKELASRLGPPHWRVIRPSHHPVLGLLQDQKRGQVVPPSFSISILSSANRRPPHCPCRFAKATIFPARRGSQRTRRPAPTRQSNKARRPRR